MWEQVAAQVLGRAAASPDNPAPTRSGLEGAAYSADGYTVTTGGSRAAGASVSKAGDPLAGVVAPLGTAVQGVTAGVSSNPVPWIAGAVAIVLIAALLRRRKG